MVQLVLAPEPIKALETKQAKADSVTQKEKEFQRGISMSLLLKKRGIIKFPKLPIRIGITAKKIIIKAWAVKTVW